MSRRISVAMCITTVPSAWNAEATAIRSKPASSIAQRRISRGSADAKRSFADIARSVPGSVCIGPSPSRTVQGRDYRGGRLPGDTPKSGGPSLALPPVMPPVSLQLCLRGQRLCSGLRPRPKARSHMLDSDPIAPHGGKLVDLLVPEGERDRAREEARNLPKLTVNERELSDLEMLAVGALSPLTGFLGEKD